MHPTLRALSTLAVVLGLVAVAPAQQQDRKKPSDNAPRATLKHYNLDKKKVAIQGYDPVAYFPEGGGKAKKGSARYTVKHQGVVYRFATRQNLERFQKTPSKFEPAYGGWCAYAMRDGNKVEVDAESFLIQNGRLMLFYNGFFNNTRKSWSKGDTKAQEKKADGRWRRLSGESAKAKKKPLPKKRGVEKRKLGRR